MTQPEINEHTHINKCGNHGTEKTKIIIEIKSKRIIITTTYYKRKRFKGNLLSPM